MLVIMPNKTQLLPSLLNIIQLGLQANTHLDPRGITKAHRFQQLFGRMCQEFAEKPNSTLKMWEVPLLVSAAKTNDRVSFYNTQKGMIYWQYVRPAWYIGAYYTVDPSVSAEQLGVSMLVDDPADPTNKTKYVSRIKAEFIVVSEEESAVAVTIAEPVNDNWSRRGISVLVQGGEKQHYLALHSQEKNKLVIVKPEAVDPNSPDEYAAYLAEVDALTMIATKNSMELLTKVEIQRKYNIKDFIKPYSWSDAPIVALTETENIDLQRQACESAGRGQYYDAIDLLKKVLAQLADPERVLAKAVLGCLYQLAGNITDGQVNLQTFFNFFDKADDTFKQTYTQFYYYALQQYALCHTQAEDIILHLKQLQKKIDITEQQRALIHLDLGIQLNRIASRYSDDITSHDFDSSGKIKTSKNEAARGAENYLRQAIGSNKLNIHEAINAQTELAFALRKQNKVAEAANILYDALTNILAHENAHHHESKELVKDIYLQRLAIKLGLGLALCRCGDKSKLRVELQDEIYEPFDYLEKLLDNELKNLTIMETRILFNRWVGENDSDLFMRNWYLMDNKERAKKGTLILEFYRAKVSLEIAKICNLLRDNRIDNLELSYLGEPSPTGISDDDFVKLVNALRDNTSLRKLYIRRISGENNSERLTHLFDALTVAYHNGQHLTYLYIAGARYKQKTEIEATLNYLRVNQTLEILHPALFDWKSNEYFTQLAHIIKDHPTLCTFLPDIIRHSGAGSLLAEACVSADNIIQVYPFAGRIFEEQGIELANNIAFERARLKIANKVKQTQLEVLFQTQLQQVKSCFEKDCMNVARRKDGGLPSDREVFLTHLNKLNNSHASFFDEIRALQKTSLIRNCRPIAEPTQQLIATASELAKYSSARK